jgi:5-methylcytosine-specific restriction endonuclease McrA
MSNDPYRISELKQQADDCFSPSGSIEWEIEARKAISKTLRFEIFKRDSFTCQYCGERPPNVALEVDHIVAVAMGGKTEAGNLVTACKDCNRGKGKRTLTSNFGVDSSGS